MKLDMDGNAGIVTGAAGGIGLSIARALLDAGADVLLVDLREDVEDAAQRLNARAQVADLAEDGGAGEMVERAVAEWGRIDFLVNAAGIQARGPAIELSDEDWERLHAVNLRAVFRGCRAAAPSRAPGRPTRPAGRSFAPLAPPGQAGPGS